MLLLYLSLYAKLLYTQKKALVARYEIKFLFHKEILDPVPELSLFSHPCWCLAIGDVLIHKELLLCCCLHKISKTSPITGFIIIPLSNQLLFAVFVWGCQ